MGKKVVNLLKGVAYTGAAVGGLSVLSNADLVFAEEAEEVLNSTSSGEIELQVEATQENNVVETSTEVTQQTEQQSTLEIDESSFTIETATEAIEEAETDKATTEQAITDDTTALEQAESDKAAAEVNLQQAEADKSNLEEEIGKLEQEVAPIESQITETQGQIEDSEEEKAGVEQQKDAAVAEETAKEEELASTQQDAVAKQEEYDASAYNQDGVSALEGQISTQTNAMLQVKDNLLKQGVEYLSGAQGEQFYKDYTRPLALTMIKYNLLISGEVTPIDVQHVGTDKDAYIRFSENFKGGYENKHFCIRYVDTEGVLQEKYFDYVFCNDKGESVFKEGNSNNDAKLSNLYGINVVEKIPNYKYTEDNTFIYWTEKTSEVKSLISQGKVKEVVINKKSYYVLTRDESKGFSECENGQKKGIEYYKDSDFKNDLATHAQYIQDIAQLNAKIQSLGTDITNLQNDIDGYDGTIAALADTIGQLSNQLSDLQAQAAPINANITAYNTLLDGVNSDIQGYQDQIDALTTVIDGLKVSIQENTGKLSDINAKIELLEKILANLKAQQANATASAATGDTSPAGEAVASSSERYYNSVVTDVRTSVQAQNEAQAPAVNITETQTPVAGPVAQAMAVDNVEIVPIEDELVPLNVVDAELSTDDMEFRTIADEEVAKAGGITAAAAAFHIGILPTIGTITGIVGSKKTNNSKK